MSLQRLVHAQVARRSAFVAGRSSYCVRRVQLDHLEQAALATAGDPALRAIPGDDLQVQVVRDRDLLRQVHEHGFGLVTCWLGFLMLYEICTCTEYFLALLLPPLIRVECIKAFSFSCSYKLTTTRISLSIL